MEQTSPVPSAEADPRRARIIEAAFTLLMEQGYAGAGTREIARRARVSKRELYALFGSKRGVVAAMIAGRTARMREPLALPQVADRAALAETLTRFGIALVREVSRPEVLALFRLAVAEVDRSPELARTLDEGGRHANRRALVDFLACACERGLIAGAAAEDMAGEFLALLWGDLLLRLLLRRAEPPLARDIEQRASDAAENLLALHPAAASMAESGQLSPGRGGAGKRGARTIARPARF
jgi:AcrR family transcriptional regulator